MIPVTFELSQASRAASACIGSGVASCRSAPACAGCRSNSVAAMRNLRLWSPKSVRNSSHASAPGDSASKAEGPVVIVSIEDRFY